MLIIDDKHTCSICGAYFQDNGYCANGHLREVDKMVDDVRKSCCNTPMFFIDHLGSVNGTDESSIYLCGICGSYLKEEIGFMDFEDMFNIIGVNWEDVENFDTLSYEELSKVFITHANNYLER
jgi:hypothetical protein